MRASPSLHLSLRVPNAATTHTPHTSSWPPARSKLRAGPLPRRSAPDSNDYVSPQKMCRRSGCRTFNICGVFCTLGEQTLNARSRGAFAGSRKSRLILDPVGVLELFQESRSLREIKIFPRDPFSLGKDRDVEFARVAEDEHRRPPLSDFVHRFNRDVNVNLHVRLQNGWHSVGAIRVGGFRRLVDLR